MKASQVWIAVLLLTGGCGGCERPPVPSGTGGGAASGAKPPAVATATAGLPPRATPAAAAPGGAPGVPGAAVPGGIPADEGDCIVIGDATPDYGAPPLNVELSAEAECSAGQPKFRWDFGDGSAPVDQANTTHTYKNPGDFTAVITVTGPDGSTSTDEIDITVEEDAADLE
ncbi:PKD domain-containing protein [Candidatus Binatia bacterium]|nr:PKD domain-containing protein [Candidatus Binatia bacterium]